MRSWEVKKIWHWNFVNWWVLNKEHSYKEPCRKCSPKANSRPLFNLVIKLKQNSHCIQGIFIQTRYFEREFIKSFKKLTLCTRMLSVCHSYILLFICMSLVCTRMSSICYVYVLVCHPYVTRLWFYHEPNWNMEKKKLLGNTKYNQVKLALAVFASAFCIRFLFKFY